MSKKAGIVQGQQNGLKKDPRAQHALPVQVSLKAMKDAMITSRKILLWPLWLCPASFPMITFLKLLQQMVEAGTISIQ